MKYILGPGARRFMRAYPHPPVGAGRQAAAPFVYNAGFRAGIAQLVERNLAKVEVASSSLVSRSIFSKGKHSFPFLSQATVWHMAR